ncbi:hypothetical protein, partial [Acinetobacter baumannii]|uniref:hypothetical protein n=1 Tax=Acinetobacter baumannii TaxID=470 RepID=UPI001C0776B7
PGLLKGIPMFNIGLAGIKLGGVNSERRLLLSNRFPRGKVESSSNFPSHNHPQANQNPPLVNLLRKQ